MKAVRSDDNQITLTLSLQEAHVLIWGGPKILVERLNVLLRIILVNIEDHEFSDREYRAFFKDLGGMYDKLAVEIKKELDEING